MRKRLLPENVTAFKDRHGKERLRFRKRGFPTHYFTADFGTEEFRTQLRACLDTAKQPAGAHRAKPGTFDDLIAKYYRSTRWLKKSRSDATRAHDRRIIESFRAKHGHRVVADMNFEDCEKLLTQKADTPTAANKLRKQMKRLLDYAIQIEMRRDNPMEKTESMSVESGGHRAWTEGELAQFRDHWAIGTKPRLALEIMLWTGNRRGDALTLGQQHIKNGRFEIVQEKTGKSLKIKIAPQLRAAIAAMPVVGQTSFLVTHYGQPFTRDGFGNRFREWVAKAGLPKECRPHGLRKTIMRRMADRGHSNQGMKSVSGHSGDSEVALYTREADQMSLADRAIDDLAGWELANLEDEQLANLSEGAEKQ